MTPTIHDRARALMMALADRDVIGPKRTMGLIEAAMRKLLRDAAKEVHAQGKVGGEREHYAELILRIASEGEGESHG